MDSKTSPGEFRLLAIDAIAMNPDHPRKQVDEAALKGLVNAIRRTGIIHPLVVQPAGPDGLHRLVVGQRRLLAAKEAELAAVPVLIRSCTPAQALEMQLFENLGLGVRAALEPRDMANALQAAANAFDTADAAAEHFGRNANWLKQATAAANLTPQVSALLDSGKITSASTAIEIDKLARKDEEKAEALISQIAQLPEGEKKAAKQVVASALSEAGLRRGKKKESNAPAAQAAAPAPASVAPTAPLAAPAASFSGDSDIPPWEEIPAAPVAPTVSKPKVNPGKVKRVAHLLGLEAEDEEVVLARLIDEFLALKGEEFPE